MKESVEAAISFVRSQSHIYGINPMIFDKTDIHVHVPEGATPKDGPSAGIAIFNSIVSALTNIKVKKNIAMTGEITLRGRILPIGGLKEKLLAAARAGIKTVLIPYENKRDLPEVPRSVITKVKVVPIENANDLLKYTFVKAIKPIKIDESKAFKSLTTAKEDKSIEGQIAH